MAEVITSSCIFCYKKVSTVTSRNGDDNSPKFLQLFAQYLNIQIQTRIDIADGEVLSCDDCFKLVNNFCNVFVQWENLRLQLDWKVRQLFEVMRATKSVLSIDSDFQNENFDANVVHQKFQKLRDELLRGSTKHLSSSLPKLVLKKVGREEDEESEGVIGNILQSEDETEFGNRRQPHCQSNTNGEVYEELQVEVQMIDRIEDNFSLKIINAQEAIDACEAVTLIDKQIETDQPVDDDDGYEFKDKDEWDEIGRSQEGIVHPSFQVIDTEMDGSVGEVIVKVEEVEIFPISSHSSEEFRFEVESTPVSKLIGAQEAVITEKTTDIPFSTGQEGEEHPEFDNHYEKLDQNRNIGLQTDNENKSSELDSSRAPVKELETLATSEGESYHKQRRDSNDDEQVYASHDVDNDDGNERKENEIVKPQENTDQLSFKVIDREEDDSGSNVVEKVEEMEVCAQSPLPNEQPFQAETTGTQESKSIGEQVVIETAAIRETSSPPESDETPERPPKSTGGGVEEQCGIATKKMKVCVPVDETQARGGLISFLAILHLSLPLHPHAVVPKYYHQKRHRKRRKNRGTKKEVAVNICASNPCVEHPTSHSPVQNELVGHERFSNSALDAKQQRILVEEVVSVEKAQVDDSQQPETVSTAGLHGNEMNEHEQISTEVAEVREGNADGTKPINGSDLKESQKLVETQESYQIRKETLQVDEDANYHEKRDQIRDNGLLSDYENETSENAVSRSPSPIPSCSAASSSTNGQNFLVEKLEAVPTVADEPATLAHHLREKRYKCEFEGCGKSYFSNADFYTHRLRHKRDQPFHCWWADCSFKCSLPGTLNLHLKREHNATQGQLQTCSYRCRVCGIWFGNSISLSTHLSSHEEPTGSHITMKAREITIPTVEDHNYSQVEAQAERVIDKDITSVAPVLEPESNTTIFASTSLEKPTTLLSAPIYQIGDWGLQTAHFSIPSFSSCVEKLEAVTVQVATSPDEEISRKLYKCDFEGCTKSYAQEAHLKSHRLHHTRKKLYKCWWPECNLKFCWPGKLTSHLQYHHKTTPEQLKGASFRCQFCRKRFASSNSLSLHLSTHDDHPGKKASVISPAEDALRFITSVLSTPMTGSYHRCQQCQLQFLSPDLLAFHLSIHEKPRGSHSNTYWNERSATAVEDETTLEQRQEHQLLIESPKIKN